jgi:hypothetical protein
MWIQGRRRGGAKALADHLKRTDENESVKVLAIEGFAFSAATLENLDRALRQMEANGYAKGNKRNIYHAMIAPAYGESLTKAQLAEAIAYYTKKMGFSGHQCVAVEHRKKGKAHYHLVFDIINPATGKIHELKFTKRKEWAISRELEKAFGHMTPEAKGKAVRTWETQRGNRSGIDAIAMTKEVTAIYRASKTAGEFVDRLEKAGYTLARTDKNKLVLVDKAGDTHGLLRRLKGVEARDLRLKFPGIGKMDLPDHAKLVAQRKPKRIRKATPYKGGLRLASSGKPTGPPRYKLLKPLQSAKQAGKFLADRPSKQEQQGPVKPVVEKKGWPEAAILDWEVWGHRNPPRFFALWPELSP